MFFRIYFQGLEKTRNSLNKNKKKKSNKNHDGDEDNDNDDESVDMSKQRVLDWPVGKTAQRMVGVAKKHKKGYQKKQNAQL